MPPRYDEWWCFEHIEIAGAFATKRTREVLTEPAVFQIKEVPVGPGPDPLALPYILVCIFWNFPPRLVIKPCGAFVGN